MIGVVVTSCSTRLVPFSAIFLRGSNLRYEILRFKIIHISQIHKRFTMICIKGVFNPLVAKLKISPAEQLELYPSVFILAKQFKSPNCTSHTVGMVSFRVQKTISAKRSPQQTKTGRKTREIKASMVNEYLLLSQNSILSCHHIEN